MKAHHSAEKDAPCPCGHPPDDHSLGDGCMHLCDCAWPTAEKGAGHIDLAVDRDGNRYTTHCFGFDGDPWRGATILTPSVVRGLSERGLLPLTECVIPPTERTNDE